MCNILVHNEVQQGFGGGKISVIFRVFRCVFNPVSGGWLSCEFGPCSSTSTVLGLGLGNLPEGSKVLVLGRDIWFEKEPFLVSSGAAKSSHSSSISTQLAFDFRRREALGENGFRKSDFLAVFGPFSTSNSTLPLDFSGCPLG